MKNILVISLVLFFTLCFFCGCAEKKGDKNPTPYMIYFDFLDRPFYESWTDKDAVINVNINIQSEFSDDAFIVLTAVKEYSPYTIYHVYDKATNVLPKDSIVYHHKVFEGFSDSLKIEGFDICSYMQFRHYYDDSVAGTFVGAPNDFPVYFKKISVSKGKSKENFKIVFPRELVSILGKVEVNVGIGRLNDEINRRFENFPGEYELTEQDKDYVNFYFDIFPDSSNSSLVFSNFLFLEEMSLIPDVSVKITGKRYFKAFPRINLNGYPGAPEIRFDEYIYR